MTKIIFKAMPSKLAEDLRKGGQDAHGLPAERALSDGGGLPCRHCMKMIEKDAPYLIFSYKPFATTQAYAEQGPVFLHAEAQHCPAYVDTGVLPSIFDSARYMLRGYDKYERIVYGTGRIIEREKIKSEAQNLLSDKQIDFLHIRSASNNCWQGRIEREE